MMSVTRPQNSATRLYDLLIIAPLAVTMSPIALPARERPMIATVGPMMTGGMSLDTHLLPANLIIIAKTTYTSPASTAPRMIPQYPNANAVESELKNAKELDMMTGLLNFVKRR